MQLLLERERLRRKLSYRKWARALDSTFTRTYRLTTTAQAMTLPEFERLCQRIQVHPDDMVIWEGVPEPRTCPCCCHRMG